jgi:hypothetical protein
MVFRKDGSYSYPKRKISETFLDFAAPIVSMVDLNTTEAQLEEGFKVAWTVWNAVVMDTACGTSRYVRKLHKLTAGHPLPRGIIDQMIARKRELFGEDQRLIGNYKLTYKGDVLHVWAEARAPNLSRGKTEGHKNPD